MTTKAKKDHAAWLKKYNGGIAKTRSELVAKIMAIRPSWDQAALEAHAQTIGTLKLQEMHNDLVKVRNLDADFTAK